MPIFKALNLDVLGSICKGDCSKQHQISSDIVFDKLTLSPDRWETDVLVINMTCEILLLLDRLYGACMLLVMLMKSSK